jgi:predicted dehydrogenase
MGAAAVTVAATKPRLGFLGVGWIGRHRLDAIVASGAAEVAAIADPALPDALDSLDDLLDRELDGVVIATPSALHAEQAVEALERGLAVFCQKPLGRTAPETRRVVDAARAADRLLAVDLSYRFVEGARVVRELVRSGDLGQVFAVELAFHNAYGPDRPWFYARELAGGGCVIDLGIHLVDLALWTLDWPEVIGVSSRLRGEPVEEYAVAQLDLATGAVVRLSCSWHLPAGRDCAIEATFYGSGGGASLRNVGGSFYDFVAQRYQGTQTEPLVQPPDDWGGRAIVEWARRVAAGERFDSAAERLVEVAEVLDRIYGRSP